MNNSIVQSNDTKKEIKDRNYRINPIALAVFAFTDVFLYCSDLTLFQYAFTFVAYLYVTIQCFRNFECGILYFLSFNILSIGVGNYWGITDVISYWGVRLGPFSFNILFTVCLTLCYCIKKNFKKLLPNDQYSHFFIFLLSWTAIIGMFMTIIGYNYPDNFINDLLTFLPILFYIIIIKDIPLTKLLITMKYIVIITMLSLIEAYVFDRRAPYSDEYFIIGNAMSVIIPIGIIVLSNFLDKRLRIFFICSFIFFFVTSSFLFGGKTIISFIVLAFWLLLRNKKNRNLHIIICLAIIPLLIPLLRMIVENSTNGIIGFKFSQVLSILDNPQLFDLATEYSSVGNLIAEGLTLFTYLISNPLILIIGKGMGAGIPDIYGFLHIFAGEAGYAEIDATRNNFFNLHLAPYKILINGGLAVSYYYLKIIINLLKNKSAFGFLAFVMMLTYFYVGKELMLLTYCFMRIDYLVEKEKQIKLI